MPRKVQRGGVTITGSGRRYSLEFKTRMVELVPAGRSPDHLTREYEPLPTAVGCGEGLCTDGLTTAEGKEFRELRAIRQLATLASHSCLVRISTHSQYKSKRISSLPEDGTRNRVNSIGMGK